MSDPIPEAYAWLSDALKPHCTKVISRESDYGETVAIGAQWGLRGDPKFHRSALIVTRHMPYQFDLNAEIEAGRVTREQAVAKILNN